jgi:hypothetical protein
MAEHRTREEHRRRTDAAQHTVRTHIASARTSAAANGETETGGYLDQLDTAIAEHHRAVGDERAHEDRSRADEHRREPDGEFAPKK